MNDKNIILERMNKRDEERIEKIQKSHKAKEEFQPIDEQAEHFGVIFQEKSQYIKKLLNQIINLSPEELQNIFAETKKEINDLQKYVASSSLFLKEFDMRKYLKNVQDLQDLCYELEEKYLPRKKFGFGRKKAAKTEPKTNVESKDAADGTSDPRILIDENFLGFDSRSDEILVLEEKKLYKRDVTIRNLSNCTISLKGNMGTLHVTNLNNCVILSGPVDTSVFVDKCIDCKIVILCQQLRMHSSKNIDVYLHVTSKGIIEDCSNINTAPYNYQYEGLNDHLEKCSLDLKSNNWNILDDFNWLSTDRPSPNWSILTESSTIRDWTNFLSHLPLHILH